MEPELVEQSVLKKLLKNSFNEGSTPFETIITKYSTNVMKYNLFYILIILLIIILLIFKMNKKIIKNDIIKNKIMKIEKIKNTKHKEKYNNISDYYTNTPRI